jgi:ATP-dependent Clp protease ATP-binding subunit ClpX
MARNLASCLELPLTISDATEYTEAGYYGKDAEVMVGELLFHTGQNVEETEEGIIFVDEIDKIARREHGARTGAGSRDIGGEGVQQALLKLLEGRTLFIPLNVTQHWSKHDFVQVDTSNILFICAGTFSELQQKKRGTDIGFRGQHPGDRGYGKITRDDLIQYGMLVEFVGRLPVITELDILSKSELIRILTEPPDSIVKEYKTLLALDRISMEFTDGALDTVAAAASRKNVGARALRSLMEEVMQEIMFNAPKMRGKKIVLDKKDVEKAIENYEPE